MDIEYYTIDETEHNCDIYKLHEQCVLNNITTNCERLVYDIVKYHSNDDINNLNITYKIITPENLNFTHKSDVLYSTITYLTKSSYAFVLTDISYESYKYKKYNNKEYEYTRNLEFMFPKKMKHIKYDSSKMHGFYNVELTDNKGYILIVDVYKKDINIERVIYNKNNYIINKDDNKYIISRSGILSSKLYEDLFILKNNNALKLISMIENENLKNNVKIVDQYSEYDKSKSIIKNDSYFMKDISTLNQYNTDNRFIQRHIYKTVYNELLCKWIINSCELYAKTKGWNDDDINEEFKINCININNLPAVFDFFINTFALLFNNIKESYNIPENININIDKCYICKYDEKQINKIDFHNDKSLITCNIALNNKNEYKGGGTYFSDGTTVMLNTGDMLVHSGKIDHTGLPVVKGTRYILVIFMNIVQKI